MLYVRQSTALGSYGGGVGGPYIASDEGAYHSLRGGVF